METSDQLSSLTSQEGQTPPKHRMHGLIAFSIAEYGRKTQLPWKQGRKKISSNVNKRPLIYFLSIDLDILAISYKWNKKKMWSLCLASLTWHVLKVHQAHIRPLHSILLTNNTPLHNIFFSWWTFDLYTKNYKTSLKEIKNLNKWKDLLVS